MRTEPFLRTFAAAWLLAAGSCAGAPEDPLTMHVTWGVTGTTALPEGVSDIEIVTCVNAGQNDEACSSFTCSVNALRLMTENEVPTCRPAAGTEMFGSDPVLVRTGLDTHTPLRFRLYGKNEAGVVQFVGQTGPFLLGTGQRRFVELHMYEVARSALVPGASTARFLHTASPLPDGRVLIAGGFTRAERIPTCPEVLGLSAETRCFQLTATSEALAFDPSSATLERIRAPMLAARAGHSATALPDGRVLIAGGATRAVLAMIPQGVAAVGGYAMALFPQAADGSEGAHASFELFDAYLDAGGDADRTADLGAGRFLGVAGQSTMPGTLNQPRFMHAAAAVPAQPDLVLLAGGTGGPQSSGTYEIFDNRRAGGYGVYVADGNVLPTRRAMPSAVGIQDQVWIFGGGVVSDNAALADLWTADGSAGGVIAAASDATEFPSALTGTEEPRPEYALLRPAVAPIADGTRALVVGWYGPRCDPGMTTPTFGAPDTTELCNAPGASSTRSFTVASVTGITSPTQARARAFGATVELGCFRPGGTERYVAMTGGVANTTWSPQASIDVFTGGVDAMGAAQRSTTSLSLATPRAFHTSTALPGFGIVTLGGVTFGPTLEQVNFQSSVEVTFLASPSYEDC